MLLLFVCVVILFVFFYNYLLNFDYSQAPDGRSLHVDYFNLHSAMALGHFKMPEIVT